MKIAMNAMTLNHQIRSGLLVYIENLLNGLAEIDFNNEYFLFFASLRKKSLQMPGPVQNNFVKKVILIPDMQFPYREFILNKGLFPYFLRKYRCDIYHAPAGLNIPVVNSKVKKLVTIHDIRTLKICDESFPQNIKYLKKVLRYADICITVSNCTKKDILENFNVSPNKIKVIYVGVDERFKPIKDKESLNSIKVKYNLEDKYFFSLGQTPRKNIKRLIKAFSIFKYKNDFSLVIGGAGDDGPWVAQYQSLARKLEIEDRVKFIGYISNEDLPLLYSASECFVFPSLYEGFGIPILEAMCCGTPVITSNVSALPEIGGDAPLYVNPYDEYDIAKKMEKIVENKGLKNQIVEKGLRRSAEFSWKKMARETLDIYGQLVN